MATRGEERWCLCLRRRKSERQGIGKCEREREAKNKDSEGRCWVGAWVDGEWRKRSLQWEEMKSEERGAMCKSEK